MKRVLTKKLILLTFAVTFGMTTSLSFAQTKLITTSISSLVTSPTPTTTSTTTTTISGDSGGGGGDGGGGDSSQTTTTTILTTTTSTTTTAIDTTTTTSVITDCTDNDGDGFAIEDGVCGEVDCDDNDATVYPGAPELDDEKDNDCDGQIDECTMSITLGENDPRLDTIRQFRDEVLAKSAVGRKLIEMYYRNDKRRMEILEKHPSTKKIAKNVLEALVPVMEMLLEIEE